MARFVLTRRAARDFDEIAVLAINDCFHRVAANPSLGRPCDDLLPGARRIEQGKHVVFFRQDGDGVQVLRVLHERMLAERHLGDEEDD